MNTEKPQLLRWVLVETSHPGNVGSAARALKTMGFGDLRLINPKIQNVARESEAIALASGAGLDSIPRFRARSAAGGTADIVLDGEFFFRAFCSFFE